MPLSEKSSDLAEVVSLLQLCLRAGIPAPTLLKAARQLCEEGGTPEPAFAGQRYEDPIKRLVAATLGPEFSMDAEMRKGERRSVLMDRRARRMGWRAPRASAFLERWVLGNRLLHAALVAAFLTPLFVMVARAPAGPAPAALSHADAQAFTRSALVVSPDSLAAVSHAPAHHPAKTMVANNSHREKRASKQLAESSTKPFNPFW